MGEMMRPGASSGNCKRARTGTGQIISPSVKSYWDHAREERRRGFREGFLVGILAGLAILALAMALWIVPVTDEAARIVAEAVA